MARGKETGSLHLFALSMLDPDYLTSFAVFGNVLEKTLCTSELKLPSQHEKLTLASPAFYC